MLEAISNAKETISFLTFVYWKGNIADEFAQLFAKKAKEGVKVRVLLDSYGAFPMKQELVELMQNSGVQVVWFRPLSRWKIWKMDNRTHRKVLICDGKIAFTGGVGIAEEWTGNARNENEWRETHFKVEGNAVEGIKAAFIENWIEAGNELEIDKSVENQLEDVGSTKIQTVRTSASVRWSDIVLLYQSLIELAEKRILIQTAYFNPDDKLVELLSKRAKEGIEVKIIFPGKYTDQRATKIIAGQSFERLLEAGVELFYYQKTMMHAKVIMIDDELSCIGSANFNHRSMLKDDEINLVILDGEISKNLRAHFEEDLENSERITNFRWKKRDAVKRALEVIIRPFKQQL
jgi:cardiolipin synthase